MRCQWEKVGKAVLRGAWLRGSSQNERAATLGTHGWDPKKSRTWEPRHKQRKDPFTPEMEGLWRDPETHTRILGEPNNITIRTLATT